MMWFMLAFWTAPSTAEDLRALLGLEATFEVDGSGAVAALAMPAELVQACSSDFSDLRVYDANGAEVPYTVEMHRLDPLVQRRSIALDIDDVRHHREETPDHQVRYREGYTFAFPDNLQDDLWQLVVHTELRHFVRHAQLTGPALHVDVPIFRIGSPARERLSIALGDIGPGRVRLVLEGAGDRFLEPEFSLESTHELPPSMTLELPQVIQNTLNHSDHTVLYLARENVRARVLVLRASTPAYHRRVEVWDAGRGKSGQCVGTGSIYHVPGATPIEVNRVQLNADLIRGNQLKIVIHNDDSPPLQGLEAALELPQPHLVFAMPQGMTRGTIYFGGGRLKKPSYDRQAISALAQRTVTGDQVGVVLSWHDLSRLDSVALGSIRENRLRDVTRGMAHYAKPGAVIEPGKFSHQRRIRIAAEARDLSRISLGARDLAYCNRDLSDLRLLDENHRQWPYVLEQQSHTTQVTLTVSDSQRHGNRLYRLVPQLRCITLDQLELVIPSPYFDRGFSLSGIRPGGDRVHLANGRLRRDMGERHGILIDFPMTRVERMVLTIDQGGDAPLPIQAARAELPLAQMITMVPPGSYRLVMGQPDLPAPVYELERARSRLRAVDAMPAEQGPLEPNPDFHALSRLTSSSGLKDLLLWGALILAMVILGGLTFKLARHPPA